MKKELLTAAALATLASPAAMAASQTATFSGSLTDAVTGSTFAPTWPNILYDADDTVGATYSASITTFISGTVSTLTSGSITLNGTYTNNELSNGGIADTFFTFNSATFDLVTNQGAVLAATGPIGPIVTSNFTTQGGDVAAPAPLTGTLLNTPGGGGTAVATLSSGSISCAQDFGGTFGTFACSFGVNLLDVELAFTTNVATMISSEIFASIDLVSSTTNSVWVLTNNAAFVPAVPVPAAAWLFGSALGLLGWVRRRANS